MLVITTKNNSKIAMQKKEKTLSIGRGFLFLGDIKIDEGKWAKTDGKSKNS